LPDHLAKDLNRVTEAAPDLKDALKQAEQAAQEQVEREKQAASELDKQKATADEPEEDDPSAVALKQRAKEQKARREEERKQALAEKEQNDKLKKSLAKLKAMSRLEAIKNSERQTMEKTEGLENRAGTLIKGNRLSPGTSLDGSAREAAQASYYDRVRDKLVSNWALPPWLARQKHQAQVVIYIDSRGRIREYQFLKASGNEPFDAAVRKTLQDSQPFIPPPRELASALQSSGILVGFPL
jgi:TonB family protein